MEGVTGLLVNVESISMNIVWHYRGEPGFSMGFVEPTHDLKFMRVFSRVVLVTGKCGLMVLWYGQQDACTQPN